MAKTFSTRDLQLLGYEKAEELTKGLEKFRLFRATTTAGIQSITHHFLYLKDDGVTKEAIQAATRAAAGLPQLHVVYPDKSPPPDIAKQDVERLGPSYPYTSLIWQRLEGLFSEYVKSLRDGIPQEEWFIQPRYAGHGIDPKAKPDEDILAFLGGRTPRNLRVPAGNLLVITAPAGVGKTTLARYLVRKQTELAKRDRTIPLYVEASHWGKLQLHSVSELWEIIRNSLTTFSSSLSLREDLFEYALRQGWINFIFDGFDELCAGRNSHFRANEVLQDLSSLAQESDARIVVTTRSLFWEAEVTQTPANVTVCSLNSFNRAQATKYFEVRFSKAPALRAAAASVYSSLTPHTHVPETPGGSRAQLINTPICVAMIAEYVEQGKDSISTQRSGTALSELLIGLCERDRKRQKFVTAPRTQLSALLELAVNDAEEFDNDDLEILGFESEDIRSGRTIDHVLLTQGHENKYRMRYEFLPPYFRAVHLANCILREPFDLPATARRLVERESSGRGYVLEHLVQLLPPDSLALLANHARSVAVTDKDLRLFFFHLLKLVCDEERPKDTSTERSRLIFPSCFITELEDNNLAVRHAYVSGPIEKLDLRNIRFIRCHFKDVSFSKCLVDSTTHFESCDFRGDFGVADQVQQWRSVRLIDPRAEPPANLALGGLVAKDSLDPEALALDALRLAIDRFWHHGQLRRSMRRDIWNRGLLGGTQISRLVLDALLRAHVVETIEISSVKEGGLGVPVESIPDIKQLMDNNQLTGRIRAAYDDLVDALR